MTDQAITTLLPELGVRRACAAVGVGQAGYYRRHRLSPAPARAGAVPQRDRVQPRALTGAERTAILGLLHSDRFVDLAPAEVWATMLDEGHYLGSVSTFYRLLRAAGETRDRRRQATHPAAVKPELVATAPNQVYSWDITKLHGQAKWSYYYLYVILDIYSRYAVGWMVATRESADLAENLISQTCAKQRISRGQLTLHADRGSSMTSKPVAFLLADQRAATAVGARAVALDVTDPESIQAAVDLLGGEGGLDVVVNNAGIAGEQRPPGEATIADLRRVFETNVFGASAVLDAVTPLLQASTGPVVVNVSSAVGSLAVNSQPGAGWSMLAYPMSKAALNMLTVQYAKAFPRWRVNAVTPGLTATEFVPGMAAAAAPPGVHTVSEGAEIIVAMALIGADGPTGTFVNNDGPVPW